MRNNRNPTGVKQTSHPAAETASILYMLNFYDVWSATPDRHCVVGNAAVEHLADIEP